MVSIRNKQIIYGPVYAKSIYLSYRDDDGTLWNIQVPLHEFEKGNLFKDYTSEDQNIIIKMIKLNIKTYIDMPDEDKKISHNIRKFCYDIVFLYHLKDLQVNLLFR